MTADTDVADLERIVGDLRRSLRLAESRLTVARVALAPYRVGDVVEAKSRGEWHPVIVREVHPYSYGFSYRVSKRTKLGRWAVTQSYVGTHEIRPTSEAEA